MFTHVRRQYLYSFTAALAIAMAVSAALPGRPAAESGTSQDYKALAQILRAGGLNILVRHGATNSNETDAIPFDFADISTQRNLNEKGKVQARAFGDALRKAGIPIGKVYTSQFNRAYETATLAGFTGVEKTADLSSGGPTGPTATPEESNRRANALRALISQEPAKGMNTILVTHHPNIVDALGKDWSDVTEGEASIFKPERGKYALVARIRAQEWPLIAAAK
jgi:broad specificity phosphatase PhoE